MVLNYPLRAETCDLLVEQAPDAQSTTSVSLVSLLETPFVHRHDRYAAHGEPGVMQNFSVHLESG